MQGPPPFNSILSLHLDKATVALESADTARRKLGKIWKRKLERMIWGDK